MTEPQGNPEAWQVRLPFWRRLNGKGAVFVVVLLLYGCGLVFYAQYEKRHLLEDFRLYERLAMAESKLLEADLAVFDAVTSLLVIVEAPDRDAVLASVHQHFLVLREKYVEIAGLYPDRAESFKALLERLASSVMLPTEDRLRAFKHQLTENKSELNALLISTRLQREQAILEYQQRSDRAALVGMLLGLGGVFFSGLITSLFFDRITKDIKALGRRVRDIMDGYRGAPLRIQRNDELGQLIEGTNAMASELARREHELEMTRCRARYQEKMNTLANLAAGLVHEIGNPVAAIKGLSDVLQDSCDCGEKELFTHLGSYIERLQQLNEDLAKLAISQQSEYGLLNLNDLIQSACSHIRFDERWYGVDVEVDLAPDLPAIYGYGDQLILVLIHLISNAFDALMQEQEQAKSKKILVRSRRVDQDGAEIKVVDNGCGMDEQTLIRAFDPFFTTKAEQQGTGLGLPLCQTVISSHGGSITVESEFSSGTEVTVKLPQRIAECAADD